MKLEIIMTYIVDAPDDNMHRPDALDYADEVVERLSAKAGVVLHTRDVDMVKE